PVSRSGRGVWERAQLVHEVCGRDVAVEDVAHESAQMSVELAGQRRIETQARRRVEVAHEKVAERLQRADREWCDVWQARRAAGADRATGRGLPRVGLLGQHLAALRALAELGSEPGSIE